MDARDEAIVRRRKVETGMKRRRTVTASRAEETSSIPHTAPYLLIEPFATLQDGRLVDEKTAYDTYYYGRQASCKEQS